MRACVSLLLSGAAPSLFLSRMASLLNVPSPGYFGCCGSTRPKEAHPGRSQGGGCLPLLTEHLPPLRRHLTSPSPRLTRLPRCLRVSPCTRMPFLFSGRPEGTPGCRLYDRTLPRLAFNVVRETSAEKYCTYHTFEHAAKRRPLDARSEPQGTAGRTAVSKVWPFQIPSTLYVKRFPQLWFARSSPPSERSLTSPTAQTSQSLLFAFSSIYGHPTRHNCGASTSSSPYDNFVGRSSRLPVPTPRTTPPTSHLNPTRQFRNH